MAHAGVALTDTYELEVEEELDERTPCYKVEFKAGGMEYEYKIDARTGGVLTYEMDRGLTRQSAGPGATGSGAALF